MGDKVKTLKRENDDLKRQLNDLKKEFQEWNACIFKKTFKKYL